MRALGPGSLLLLLLLLLPVGKASAQEDNPLTVGLSVAAAEATVGDRVAATLTIEAPAEARLVEPPTIGPDLGSVSVVAGDWSGPEPFEGRQRWTWNGSLVSFRTGEFEIPSIRVELRTADGLPLSAETEPVALSIRSVLDEAETEGSEIADLKPPAGIEPDYGPVLLGAGLFGLLLLMAAVLWWLQRRFGAKLAAVPTPEDPFHRTPPHEWVYSELQRLLERRLAEAGQVDRFFGELSRIVKLYLGGRYRIELLEQTTMEVPERLAEAGAGRDAIDAVCELLQLCDRVKFAGESPGVEACRESIESAYRIVDATKPREAAAERDARGAA